MFIDCLFLKPPLTYNYSEYLHGILSVSCIMMTYINHNGHLEPVEKPQWPSEHPQQPPYFLSIQWENCQFYEYNIDTLYTMKYLFMPFIVILNTSTLYNYHLRHQNHFLVVVKFIFLFIFSNKYFHHHYHYHCLTLLQPDYIIFIHVL